MTLDYTNSYYDHFSKYFSKKPPSFSNNNNYIMRFHAPLESYIFDNNSLSIIYFKKGTGQLYWKDKKLKIKDNKFIVANPGLGWEYDNAKQHYIDVLSFVISDALRYRFNYYRMASENQLLENPLGELTDNIFFFEHLFGADHYRSGRLLQQIYRLSSEMDYSQTNPEELCIEILQAVYEEQYKGYVLASKVNAKKTSTKLETLKRLSLAREYIHDHISDSISLNELSTVASLSKYHLYNSFKNVYGKTPHQYINKVKVAKAMEYLQQGQFPIGKIADLLGFNDLAVFSKIFKKVYGKPPSHYL